MYLMKLNIFSRLFLRSGTNETKSVLIVAGNHRQCAPMEWNGNDVGMNRCVFV